MQLILRTGFFFLLGLLLVVSHPGFSQNLQWERTQVEILLSEAEQDRRFASDRLDFAKSYDERAERARENAANSRLDSDRQSWLQIAEESEAKAQEFRDQANALIASAERKEAEAGVIQARIDEALANAPPPPDPEPEAHPEPQVEPTTSENEDRGPAMPLNQVFGVWYRDLANQSEPFVIVPPGAGGEATSLEAHTDNRVWEGSYSEAENPEEGRMTFTYKPTPEEMNPDIPEWVRNQIEGQLEWQIELNEPCGCGSAGLEGKFFPGEVEWQEDGGENPESVQIVGKGEAREFKLARSSELNFETFGYARIAVNIKGDRDPFLDPIDGLTKLQRFTILVDMPVKMAEEAGDKIQVTITNLTSEDSMEIELEKISVRGGHTTRYSHYNEATFADDSHVTESDYHPSFMSMSYITGNQGARLGLEVENANQVEFKYGEATQVVPVYNSWVQRNIARHEDAAALFRFLCGATIQGNAPDEKKERATQCLSMIRNYENIMASDTIHDYIRYRIGDIYFNPNFGIIGKDPREVENRMDAVFADIRDEDRLSEEFPGVVWTSGVERTRIMRRANAARAAYRDIARNEISKAITYALYDYVMGQTGVGDAYTVFTGRDIFNKPTPGWQRVVSAIGLTSSTTLSFTMPRVLPRIATMPSLERSLLTRGQAGGTFRYGRKTSLGEETISNGPASTPESLPSTLNDTQVQIAGPRQIPAAETYANASVTCGVEPNVTSAAPLPSNPTPPPAPPRPLPSLDPDLASLQARYGVDTEPVNPGAAPLERPQVFGTCNGGSVTPNIAKETQLTLDEGNLYRWLTKNGFTEPGRAVLTDGYLTKNIQKFLEFLGAQTVAIRSGSRLTLEEISIALENGWYVRDVVKVLDGEGLHAIDVRQIIKDADGNITHVVWYDSAYGKELKTTACNYRDNLASDLDNQITYRWR